jgi:hypothetical protein
VRSSRGAGTLVTVPLVGLSVVPVVVTVVAPPPVGEPPVVPLPVASAPPRLAARSVTATKGTRRYLVIMSVSDLSPSMGRQFEIRIPDAFL